MSKRHAATPSSPRTSGRCGGLETIPAIAAQLARTPDAMTVANTLLEALTRATASSRASLMVLNPATGRLAIAAGVGLPAHLLGQDVVPRPRSIAEWVFRNRRPIRLEGAVQDKRFESSGEGSALIESSVSLPLEASGASVGVLNLARHSPAPRFTDIETDTLAGSLPAVAECLVAAQTRDDAARNWTALARHAASRCSLMPLGTLQVRGYELAFGRRGSARLACDAVERVAHPSGGHSLMVLDVSGVGAEAAALAAFVQGLFVAQAPYERSAAAIVTRLNAELVMRHGGRRIASLWVAQLSRTGEAVVCRAGYPPARWVPADGSPQITLDEGGPSAGALATARYGEERLRLLPGDLIVLTSDGVLESRGTTDQSFGPERVAEVVDERRRMPLDSVCEAILDSATAWSGRPVPTDDAIAFALRYAPGD